MVTHDRNEPTVDAEAFVTEWWATADGRRLPGEEESDSRWYILSQ